MRVAEAIRAQSLPRDTVAIWWLGQNSYVIRGAGVSVMIDPFFSRPKEPERYVHAHAPIRADEIEPDAVFCTHNHSDHTDPPFLTALAQHSPATTFLGPPESVQAMIEGGIPTDRVHALRSGDRIALPSSAVEVVLSKTPEVSDVSHLGYVIELAGVRVYDTGDVMKGVTREPTLVDPLRRASPDIALITSSPTEDEFPDFGEAAEFAVAIGARIAVPAHYDCFARRTFDPQGFAAAFEGLSTRAEIIPYGGCLLHPLR